MISLLETQLYLISTARADVVKFMHPIVRNLLYESAFFSITGNAIEYSFVADKRTADEFISIDPTCSVCLEPMQAYQVDLPHESNTRIDTLSRALSAAHISIFYLSTYQTDFIFVKEKHTARVLHVLAVNGFDVESDIQPDDNIQTAINDMDDEPLLLKKEFSPSEPLTLVGLDKRYREQWAHILLCMIFYSQPELPYISSNSRLT